MQQGGFCILERKNWYEGGSLSQAFCWLLFCGGILVGGLLTHNELNFRLVQLGYFQLSFFFIELSSNSFCLAVVSIAYHTLTVGNNWNEFEGSSSYMYVLTSLQPFTSQPLTEGFGQANKNGTQISLFMCHNIISLSVNTE